jgi:hypothetical protein
MAEETTQEAPATEQGLQLTDLRIMMQILDVVTARGAIKADEMTTVGTLYGKLKTFVDQTTTAATAEQSAEETATATADAEDSEGGSED